MRSKIKQILKEQIIQEVNNNKVPIGKEFGYHAGNLEELTRKKQGTKSETSPGYPGKGDGSGLRHTGTYFFSDPERAAKKGGKETPFWAVDFSKYNMWEPKSSSAFYKSDAVLHMAVKLYSEKGKITDELENRLPESIKNHTWELIVKIVRNSDDVERALNNKAPEDIPRTAVLKGLGYEGVDIRDINVLPGEGDPDREGFGSIIFDIKYDTVYGPFYGFEKVEENNIRNIIRELQNNIPLLKKFGKLPSIDENPRPSSPFDPEIDFELEWYYSNDIMYQGRFPMTISTTLEYKKYKEDDIEGVMEIKPFIIIGENTLAKDKGEEVTSDIKEKIEGQYRMKIEQKDNGKDFYDRVNNVLSELLSIGESSSQ